MPNASWVTFTAPTSSWQAPTGERASTSPRPCAGPPTFPRPPSIRDFMAFEEHVRNASRGLAHEVNPVWYEIPLFYFTNEEHIAGFMVMCDWSARDLQRHEMLGI